MENYVITISRLHIYENPNPWSVYVNLLYTWFAKYWPPALFHFVSRRPTALRLKQWLIVDTPFWHSSDGLSNIRLSYYFLVVYNSNVSLRTNYFRPAHNSDTFCAICLIGAQLSLSWHSGGLFLLPHILRYLSIPWRYSYSLHQANGMRQTHQTMCYRDISSLGIDSVRGVRGNFISFFIESDLAYIIQYHHWYSQCDNT